MTKYTTTGLHAKVGNALLEFFRKDDDLLFLDVNERSITHKLAEHLQCQFEDNDELKVDCEYNRRGKITKKLPWGDEPTRKDCLRAKTVYPDIIVHRRGYKCDNLLLIEVKKSNGDDAHRDEEKLRAFTMPGGDYEYELGLFLEIDVAKKRMNHVECFKDGSKKDGCSCCTVLSEISDSGHSKLTATWGLPASAKPHRSFAEMPSNSLLVRNLERD